MPSPPSVKGKQTTSRPLALKLSANASQASTLVRLPLKLSKATMYFIRYSFFT